MGSCTSIPDPLWLAFDRTGLPLAAIFDFVTDVAVSSQYVQSSTSSVHLMGVAGFIALGVSTLVNVLLIAVHACTQDFKHWQNVYVKMIEREYGIALAFWTIIACTNLEVLMLFFVMWRMWEGCIGNEINDGQNIDLEDTESTDKDKKEKLKNAAFVNDIRVAEFGIKRLALWSQLFENLPELCIQVLAVTLQIKAGEPVTLLSIGSIVGTSFMLFFKMMTNLVVNIFWVTDAYYEDAEETWKEWSESELEWRKDPTKDLWCSPKMLVHWLLFLISLPIVLWAHVFLCSCAFHSGIGHHSRVLISIYGCVWAGAWLLFFFLARLLDLKAPHRDDGNNTLSYHLQFFPNKGLLVTMCSVFSPGLAQSIHPAISTAWTSWMLPVHCMVTIAVLLANRWLPAGVAHKMHSTMAQTRENLEHTSLSSFMPPDSFDSLMVSAFEDSGLIFHLLVGALLLLVLIYMVIVGSIEEVSLPLRVPGYEPMAREGDKPPMTRAEFFESIDSKKKRMQDRLTQLRQKNVVTDEEVEKLNTEAMYKLDPEEDEILKSFLNWRRLREEAIIDFQAASEVPGSERLLVVIKRAVDQKLCLNLKTWRDESVKRSDLEGRLTTAKDVHSLAEIMREESIRKVKLDWASFDLQWMKRWVLEADAFLRKQSGSREQAQQLLADIPAYDEAVTAQKDLIETIKDLQPKLEERAQRPPTPKPAPAPVPAPAPPQPEVKEVSGSTCCGCGPSK